MIKYSYTYGVVLSGAMENTGTSIKNYVSDNRQYIAQMVEKTVPQLKVTFEKIVLIFKISIAKSNKRTFVLTLLLPKNFIYRQTNRNIHGRSNFA